MRISIQELLIVLVIVLVIFGPKQLPKLAKMLGSGMKSARKAVDSVKTEDDDDDEDEKKPARAETKKAAEEPEEKE